MSRFYSDSQKGIAQVLLLVLLVVGLVAAVYGVQYARTVMNPQASENGGSGYTIGNSRHDPSKKCEGEETLCVDGRAKRYRYYISDTDESGQIIPGGSCTNDEEDLGSCNDRWCGDDLKYCDTKIGQMIYKHAGSFQGFSDGKEICKYAYDETGQTCGAQAVRTDRDPSVNPPSSGTFCDPGSFRSDICTICNASGNTYNEEGTDWGDSNKSISQWCSCAKRFSNKMEGKNFTDKNYPNCVGVNIDPVASDVNVPVPFISNKPKLGDYDAKLCRTHDGSDWNTEGTDWGIFTGGTDEQKANWCNCAEKYSQRIEQKAFKPDLYPQCLGINL